MIQEESVGNFIREVFDGKTKLEDITKPYLFRMLTDLYFEHSKTDCKEVDGLCSGCRWNKPHSGTISTKVRETGQLHATLDNLQVRMITLAKEADTEKFKAVQMLYDFEDGTLLIKLRGITPENIHPEGEERSKDEQSVSDPKSVGDNQTEGHEE